jgi:hypothetical protein
MRCNWRRWLWGVIPLVCASVAAVYLERGAIEKDLTDRATQALAAGGAHWAEVNFTGRDVALTGHATADNEPPEAEAVLRKLWGVRQVNNGANLPPKVEPYLWQANRRGDRVAPGRSSSAWRTRPCRAWRSLTARASPAAFRPPIRGSPA